MSNIQIFESPEFGQIRVIVIDGKEHFEAVSCAQKLGYANPHKVIADYLQHLIRLEVPHPQCPDKTIAKTFIPEGDLYRLIARSNVPEAEKFKQWIVGEVLPSIRKHGTYLTLEEIEEFLCNPDTIIKIATHWKEERRLRLAAEAQIKRDRLKVELANQINCPDGEGIQEFGQVLRQNGAGFGQNGFVSRLLDGKFVYRDVRTRLRPCAEHIEAGLFWTKETVISSSAGILETIQVKITGKGQDYFLKKYVPRSIQPAEAGFGNDGLLHANIGCHNAAEQHCGNRQPDSADCWDDDGE